MKRLTAVIVILMFSAISAPMLSAPLPAEDSVIYSVFAEGGTVYAAGSYFNGSRDIPCVWKGVTRTALKSDTAHDAAARAVFASGGSVYAAGHYYDGRAVNACVWKDGEMTGLAPEGSLRSAASSVYVSGGSVYAGGYYNDGKKHVACYWKDGAMTALPGDGRHDAYVSSLHIEDGKVYCAGYYSDGKKEIACMWKDGRKTDLSKDIEKDAHATGITVSGGKFFVSGGIINGSKQEPCCWDETGMHMLETPGEAQGRALSVTVSAGVVIASGYITEKSGRNLTTKPCLWKGTGITLLGPGYNSDAFAASVCISEGKTIAAGWRHNGARNVACMWTEQGAIDAADDSAFEIAVNAAAADGNDIYFGGYYNNGLMYLPCVWKDGARTTLQGRGQVLGLAAEKGMVYAAGWTINGDSQRACVWESGKKRELKSPGSESKAYAVTVSKGTVYACGSYTSASGNPVPCYWEGAKRVDLPGKGEAKAIAVHDGIVYIGGGRLKDSGDEEAWSVAVVWKGGKFTDLDTEQYYNGEVNAILVRGGVVYAAGWHSEGEYAGACIWEGKKVIPLPEGGICAGSDYTASSWATGIEELDGRIIASYYASGCGETRAFIWDGEKGVELEPGKTAEARAICVRKGKIFAAGFSNEEGRPQRACYWEDGKRTDFSPEANLRNAFFPGLRAGTVVYSAGLDADNKPCTWAGREKSVLETIEGNAAAPAAVFAHGGKVYAAGAYSDGTKNIPCYWEDGKIRPLPLGGAKYGMADAVTAPEGKVYTAGYVYDGKKMKPCVWKGTDRKELDDPDGYGGRATSVFVDSSGNVYAGGWYNYVIKKRGFTDTPKSGPCYWKNGSRVELKSDITTRAGDASSVFAVNGIVYCAGNYILGLAHVHGEPLPCFWRGEEQVVINLSGYGEVETIRVSGGTAYMNGYRKESGKRIPVRWMDNGIQPGAVLPEADGRISGYYEW